MFFVKNSTLTESNSVRAVLKFCFQFFYLKGTINENLSFIDDASGIQFPYWSELEINRKNDNKVTIFLHDIIVTFMTFFAVFLLPRLAIDARLMSISLLVLELWQFFSFYLVFFLRTFTIHRTVGVGGGCFFKSSLPLPPASHKLRH